MFEESACNCSHPLWKPTSHIMVTKVLRTTSCVHVHLLQWTQCKRWKPIGLIGCVHTHRRILANEGWGSSSCIQSVVEKIKEVNQTKEYGLTISQALALRLEHNRIQAQWALHIPLQNMLERVWWCRCSKMESWNRTICCPMSCSNERKHARTRVVGDHMPPWSVMGKGRCYC